MNNTNINITNYFEKLQENVDNTISIKIIEAANKFDNMKEATKIFKSIKTSC